MTPSMLPSAPQSTSSNVSGTCSASRIQGSSVVCTAMAKLAHGALRTRALRGLNTQYIEITPNSASSASSQSIARISPAAIQRSPRNGGAACGIMHVSGAGKNAARPGSGAAPHIARIALDRGHGPLLLDEGALDHVMRRLAVTRFREAARREDRAQVLQHRGAAAQHERGRPARLGAGRPRSPNSLPLVIRSLSRPSLRNGSRVTVG
jgi:hypothetical protein